MLPDIDDGDRVQLDDPHLAPTATAYLWNERMMVQVTARGFATAQFMQPEPAKYAHPPVLAAKTFMQPEQPYFAHHPGRFVYVRDDESGALFSAPFEPCRRPLELFRFEPGLSDIRWIASAEGLEVTLRLTLAVDDVVERWSVELVNRSGRPRRVSLVPFFPVGYASWMNMAGAYDADLQGVVCSCVTPYQKVQDYFVQKDFADLTFLVGDRVPTSWEAHARAFEGDGGLHDPDGLRAPELARGDARYELPACILQYRLDLAPDQREALRFLFGPARTRDEIAALQARYLPEARAAAEDARYDAFVRASTPAVQITSPDADFDRFVNRWLPRQIHYQGSAHRLTTDPQTRNYLQDAMGMLYLEPTRTQAALRTALAQQRRDGSMPDGILLRPDAELKYINTIPHTDHAVWLVLALDAYLDETGDHAFLDTTLPFHDDEGGATVFEHVCRAVDWLLEHRDARGLSYIAQGDWCDPMNMVGYKGRGVSAWLTEAVAYVCRRWASVCAARGDHARAAREEAHVEALNAALNTHLWDGEWYGRGITDDDRVFGTAADPEGSIFLNPQSWALLCGAPSPSARDRLLAAVEARLRTPFGYALLDPPFTGMREDIGRVTQKHPGTAENGSVYNHAAAFFAYALYSIGRGAQAYAVLRAMLPGPDRADIRRRGQLPTFIPNYYRGAHRLFPRTAGRSSNLIHTGTVAWFYRCLVEHVVGLRGSGADLVVDPQLPDAWPHLRATRRFRGAVVELEVTRRPEATTRVIRVDGVPCEGRIERPERDRHYRVDVTLPPAESTSP